MSIRPIQRPAQGQPQVVLIGGDPGQLDFLVGGVIALRRRLGQIEVIVEMRLPGGGRLADWASDWVIVPTQLAGWIAPVTYIGLIALVLGLTLLHGWVRIAVLVPTLYLAAFVWENVMLAKPEPTRYVVLGAILVAVMIVRPNGLLGERRVEIV